jgi:ssDNA-binding replication factor A large subunit
MKYLVDQIKARLKDQGIEVPEEEIVARLKKLIEKFHVPEAEARRSVLNYFFKEHGVASVTAMNSEKVKVSDIKEPGRWVDLEIKVLQLWEPTSETISQTGLVGDDTSKIKFTKWARDNLPNLAEGKSYLLKKAVTDEFQGRFGIRLNRISKIEELESEVRAVQINAAEELKVKDITQKGQWVDLRIKVLQLWEPTSETISQTGLIGDDTGKIKFTKWARDDLPNLVEGKSYLLKNAVADEFQGKISIKLNRTSKIEELPEDVPSIERETNEYLKIMQIDQPNRWIDLKAKVVQLWTSNSDAISQAGLIGDETGPLKFVKWAKADLPELAEGKTYLFKNAITDEYQGRFSLKLSSASQIEELQEDIEVGSTVAEFSGAIVEIQKGSGLIKRCPICKRALSKGMCGEHGKVDGSYDLRIKASIDDGRMTQDILINRETTERLVGLTLDEAIKMALEALENEVVRSLIEEKLVGRYYSVTGPRVDRYILVETINEMPPVSSKDVDDMIRMAEVN